MVLYVVCELPCIWHTLTLRRNITTANDDEPNGDTKRPPPSVHECARAVKMRAA